MKAPLLTATAALLILSAAGAAAQPGTIPMKFGRAPPPPPPSIGNFIGFPYYYDQRGYTHVIEREIIREVPVEAPPPPPPRDAYVVGKSYSSLPGGCMKMIEGGASYFYCSGEWYREVGRNYQAVEPPL
jgi:hypothetical protein